jgi:molybdopterin-guanine dinucleotide biosynthesis protein A
MAALGAPIGVVLAGGLGARMGGAKATVELNGRPLISYPCEALLQAVGEVVILAKADTELPSLPGVTVWVEPEVPRHPLIGVMHAIGMAEGRPVVVCALDLPFVTPQLLRRLATADPGSAPAVIAAAAGRTQPLLGCYRPQAVDLIRQAGLPPDVPVQQAIAAIGARLLEVDPLCLFNVNAPDDLLQAAAMLDRF